MKAKKSLGQHFLNNTHVLKKIVEAADVKPGDTVIEVGPGMGTLTDELLAAGAHVIAVEKDRDLIAPLQEKYKNNKNIEILEADILKFDLKRYALQATRYTVLGNIPYYLTSHLIRTVLETWPQPKVIVFTVQKEVAKRMTAKPPHMNMLAVLVQCYCDVKMVGVIKRGNFRPIPKVDSAIVKLSPSDSPLSIRGRAERVVNIAAQGFKHPRKKLSNNLPKELLERAGIDPDRRAETLSVDEWKSLTDSVI